MKVNTNSRSGSFNVRLAIAVSVCLSGICLSIFAGTTKMVTQKRALRRSPATSSTLVTSQASGSATFNSIGFLPGDNSSQVRAVNADGSVAVGASGHGNDLSQAASGRLAVQWTAAGGLVTLPQIPADGTTSGGPSLQFMTGSDITPTGSWIAYRAKPGGTGRREGVICSGDFSQVIALGRLDTNPNRSSVANQISSDGSIVFGFAQDNAFLDHAFRWTSGTMVALADPAGDPPGDSRYTYPAGRGCTSDGSVSVGYSYRYDGTTGNEADVQAFRWTQATGIQLLGYLPGGDRSAALAISDDGSLVFGVSSSSNAPATATNPYDFSGELFLWSANTGTMTALGVPTGYNQFSNFAGMTSDGALLAVAVADSTGVKPAGFVVIQNPSLQSFDSNDLLVSAGLANSVSGWTALGPFGISDDGDTLFGTGIDPSGLSEGWVANFPAGYLRNVQPFNSSNPNTNLTLSSGDFIGRDGSYSANSATIGSAGGGISRNTKNLASSSGPADLTLSGTATFSVAGTLTVNSGSALNVLGAATVTAGALDITSGATLGVELNTDAESINRLTVNGTVDLSGLPDLKIVLSYAPASDTTFTIIHNTSGAPIQGQFSGLPENGTVLVGTRKLRATYSGGTTGQDFVLTVLPPPPVTGVVSRMPNSGDLPLPMTGTPGIECRSNVSAGAGNYSIVFTFANNLTSVGSPHLTSGTGSVSSSAMGPNQNQYTVNLTGVSDIQRLTVMLTTARDSQDNIGDISLPMAVLVGDTNADTYVDSIDTSETKSESGHPVTPSNLRDDVNGDGYIDAVDVAMVKSKSSHHVASPSGGVAVGSQSKSQQSHPSP
jgi:probable HAF family extracellular repeat protein